MSWEEWAEWETLNDREPTTEEYFKFVQASQERNAYMERSAEDWKVIRGED